MNVELSEIRDFLATVPPFDQLPEEDLARLPKEIAVRYLRRGTSLPPQDVDIPYLMVVRTGAIELRNDEDELVSKFAEGGLYTAACRPEGTEATLKAMVVEDSLFYLLSCEHVQTLRDAHEGFDKYFSHSRRERLREALAALQDNRTSVSGLTRVPVGDLLAGEPNIIDPESSIQMAAQAMAALRVSSLLVVHQGHLEGIVTDNDLRSRCIAKGLPYDRPVKDIMTRDVLSLTADTPAFEALITMTRRDIHHLPVLDHGKVLGIISTTDLIRFQSTNAVYLARDVRRCESVEALARLSAKLPELHVQLVASGIAAQQIGQAITSVTDAVTVRLIECAIDKIGEPPVPFTWLAVGSQARHEHTINSDQDSALLLSDAAGPAEADYFEELAKHVTAGLLRCGFPECAGGIMASNPEWRQPLKTWKGYFERWITHPNSKAAMLASNFFDSRPLFGDEAAFNELHRTAVAQAEDNHVFIAYMAGNAVKHRPPLGFFRSFVLIDEGDHANTLDLKHRGIMPIVDLARVFALSAGLDHVDTVERLQAAAGTPALSQEAAVNLEDALALIATLRARHQSGQIKLGEAPDNYIHPETLSPLERNHLKDAFEVIATMQKVLSQRFQVGRLV
jgi:CBS domain-containing protein